MNKLEENEDQILGPKRLTIYEIARIIGARAAQIAYGAPVLIPLPKGTRLREVDIAKMELKAGVLPLTIRRELTDGRFQNVPIWKLKYVENV